MALGTGIPAKAVKAIIPILLKQLKGMSKLTTRISNSVVSLPPGAKCNDPAVKNLKKNLEKLKKLIDNIRKILKALDKIRKAINIAAGIAAGISIVQLFIPLPPFAPPGPIAKLLNIVTELAKNCKSAVMVLAGLLATIDLAVALAEAAIADALKSISSLCSNETTTVNRKVAELMAKDIANTLGVQNNSNLLNNNKNEDGNITGTELIRGVAAKNAGTFDDIQSASDGNGSGATFNVNISNGQYNSVNISSPGTGYDENDQITLPGNLLGGTSPANDVTLRVSGVFKNNYIDQYDSIFYTKYNVSTEDLDKLQDDVDELVEDARNILTNLIEAPSQAYIEYGTPSDDLGKQGDYYIDLSNNMVYGPKPSDDIWDMGTKY